MGLETGVGEWGVGRRGARGGQEGVSLLVE